MADGQVVIQVKSNAASAAKDFNKLDNSLDNVETEAKKTDKSMSNLSSTMGALGGVIAGIGLIELGKDAVKTGFQFTALGNKLKAAAGSAENGAASFEFIRKTTDELGLSFLETADAYAGFTAAATRSGLTFAETEQIFKDVATAATSLQLPAERVGLVFRALEQISSKGVVSMEELKLQLGDSLPGAVQIAAKSMGMTTKAFIDAVSAGEVLSKDFLPAFARQIKDELGGSAEDAADSLQSAFNRVSNSFATLQSEITSDGSGVNSVLKFMAIGLEEINTQLAIFVGNSDSIKLEGARRELADTNLEIQELSEQLNEISLDRAGRSFDFLKQIDSEKINILNEDMDELISKRAGIEDTIKALSSQTTDIAGDAETSPIVMQTNLLKELQTEAAKTKIELQNLFLSGEEDSSQFEKTKAEYDAITGKINAAKDATKGFKESAVEGFDFAGSAADNFSRNATRALLSPWEEGETAADKFKEVAINTIADILAEFIAAELKKQAVALVTAVLTGGSSLLGGASFSQAGSSASSAYSSKLASFDKNANGGAFAGGTKKFANGGAFTNGIVSSPTTFPMAGGKTGLMGEAGAEAIMPLDRDNTGRLGVQVQQTPVVNNIINNAPVQIQTVTRPDNQNDIIVTQVGNALTDSRTSQGLSEALSRNSQTGANAF